uniref:Uncharacterized protein n=1 Tax=Cacopsylla melanoneura TaxID=428564 RepID=A0A8D9FC61_9HEMI
MEYIDLLCCSVCADWGASKAWPHRMDRSADRILHHGSARRASPSCCHLPHPVGVRSRLQFPRQHSPQFHDGAYHHFPRPQQRAQPTHPAPCVGVSFGCLTGG